jgi:fibronectin-binding autotransporter adhesin
MTRIRSNWICTLFAATFLFILYLGRAEGAAITWDAGGGANLTWAEVTNWSDNADPSGDTVTFNTVGASATAGTVTNIVNASVTVAGLTYSGLTGATNTHTTQIDAAQTLTVNGNFLLSPVASNVGNVTFTGGGTLAINGTSFVTGGANAVSAQLTLASSNTVIVDSFTVTVRGNDNWIKLGNTNTLRADTFNLGQTGTSAPDGSYLRFREGLSGTPTVQIRAKDGIGRADLIIAQFSQNSGNPLRYNVNFDATGGGTAGNVDALLDELVIGRKLVNGSAAGRPSGALSFNQGTIDASTIVLGDTASGVPDASGADGTITVAGSGTLIAGTITFLNNVGNVTGTGGDGASKGIVNISTGGTVRAATMLAGVNGGTRTINFNDGKIQNKSGGDLAINSGLTLNILTSGTHTFEADSGRTITVSSSIGGAGTGNVVKAGDGTLILCAANNYSAATMVNDGTLRVDGSITSNTDVNSGGTLGGSGTITGNVVVDSNGRLAPGSSIGTLTVAGDVSLSNGALFTFELASPGASDQVNMNTGELTLDNQEFADFTFLTGGGFGVGTYVLFDADSVTGTLGASVSGLLSGFNSTLAVVDDDLVLTVTSVPEPTSSMILLGSMLGLWRLRRK